MTAYRGDNDEVNRLINETLDRLRPRVRKFVNEVCSFFSLGKDLHGSTWTASGLNNKYNANPNKLWIILLDERSLFDNPEVDPAQVVAHEIAHAWFGSQGHLRYADEPWIDEQVRAWLEE